jgi:hypothetical protein
MEKVFEWTTPDDAVRSEVAYWAAQSIVDRVSAVETLREVTLGIYSDETPARLERVYQLTVRPSR